jgi:hypothetical protein
MGPRLLALALASVIAAAPVAAQVCEIRCAGHPEHAAVTAVLHHHHPAGPARERLHGSSKLALVVRLLSPPNFHDRCAKRDAFVAESRVLVNASRFTAITATPVDVVTNTAWTTPPDGIDNRPGPLIPARSLTQLRV